jgi:Transglutaminase-like superfamily
MAANFSAIKTSDYHPFATRNYAASLHVEPLREGIDGTFQTLAAMAQAVNGQISPDFSGYQDSHNIEAANAIIGTSFGWTAKPLFQFVRDSILYINHPWNMQVVQDCKRTLEFQTGDCVSKSVCLATLLACRGMASRFVAQAPDGANYDHVYVQVLRNGQWVSLDPTADGRDGRPFGDVGWSQTLPDGGIETPYTIFFWEKIV